MVDSAVLARGPSQPIKRRSIEKPRPLRSDPDLVCQAEILKLIEDVEFGLRNYEARNEMRTRIKVGAIFHVCINEIIMKKNIMSSTYSSFEKEINCDIHTKRYCIRNCK